MQSNFDRNFESQKANFKQKFNKEWNLEPQLYLTFLQTLFIADTYEATNRIAGGISTIITTQLETHRVIQSISKKLEEKK